MQSNKCTGKNEGPSYSLDLTVDRNTVIGQIGTHMDLLSDHNETKIMQMGHKDFRNTSKFDITVNGVKVDLDSLKDNESKLISSRDYKTGVLQRSVISRDGKGNFSVRPARPTDLTYEDEDI